MDPTGKRDFRGKEKWLHSLRFQEPRQITLPERAGQAPLYSHGIRFSQPPRKPGGAVVGMVTGLLVSGEAITMPFLAATATAKLG